ncbi:MAG TPA: hypothetical protein EYN66_04235 [Myxococcales bacterium]|nr:hypothetical protein [Myxococcales bacterium]
MHFFGDFLGNSATGTDCESVQKGKVIELSARLSNSQQFTEQQRNRRDLERQAWSLAGNHQIDEESRLADGHASIHEPDQSFLVDVLDTRNDEYSCSTLHLVFYLS